VTRIGVIGSGAVGSYYGALLARAGHDVRFLLRRDFDAVSRAGLYVESPRGDFHLSNVACFREPQELGVCDWVLCGLKATALDQAERLCAPSVGPDTRLLAIINGLDIEDEFARWLEPQRVFGGMAFVGINRGEPGIVRHIAFGQVTIGNAADDPAGNEELAGLLRSADIETIIAPELRLGRWEKLCWNVPFNGLGVAAGGVGTQTLIDDPVWRSRAEAVMREVVAVGNADLEARGNRSRLDPQATVEKLFRLTESLGDYRTSMVIDLAEGRPLEVATIQGAVVTRARALGIAIPETEALYRAVREADEARVPSPLLEGEGGEGARD
jgi:2-dehydropantoate 2-reductase